MEQDENIVETVRVVAPIVDGNPHGYVVINRNSTGTLAITAYDYLTHAVLDTFTVQPSGAGA